MTERICTTLFIPGTPAEPTQWPRAIADAGLPLMPQTRWVANPGDGSFGRAFSFGTASAVEQQLIDAAAGAMILCLPVDLHTERARIAGLAAVLASRGALAVRIEESMLGYPIGRWVDLVGGADPWSLYRAAVVVLEDEEDEEKSGAGTCGMQVFSLPDAHVAFAQDRQSVHTLLATFNIFQLVDDPVLRSGETFSAAKDAPKQVIHRWPDARYPRSHGCHNPFGVWRLQAAGSTEMLSELTPVFVPALVTMLLAAENKLGRALTREQVEAIRDESTCIMMKPRDAQQMERKRGYADLEPALAWEQWQIARITE